MLRKEVDLSTVIDIKRGQHTINFEHEKTHELGFAKERSFSLICEDRTLDLIALTEEDFNNWYYGLKQIISHQYEVET